MPPTARLWLFAIGLCALGLSLAGAPVRADERLVPSVKDVVYPGDILTEDKLTDIPFGGAPTGGAIALSSDELIGKAAQRTLLPGKPIPLAALENPRLVRNGAEVTLIYIDGALTITTVGQAMQDGAVGDLIKVRNADSGVTVRGRVRSDGAVQADKG
jgi:flagella basal body P-ring formation protein FlgA